jgi:hypothetical protein
MFAYVVMLAECSSASTNVSMNEETLCCITVQEVVFLRRIYL